MTVHDFVNTHADGSDATLSKPSDWNRTHVDSVRSISSNTTGATTDDVVLATGGGGGISYSLPNPSQVGRVITVIKVDSGAGAVTINPFASEKLNWVNHLNQSSFILSNTGQAVSLTSDGTNWWVKYSS